VQELSSVTSLSDSFNNLGRRAIDQQRKQTLETKDSQIIRLVHIAHCTGLHGPLLCGLSLLIEILLGQSVPQNNFHVSSIQPP
jgi:hypothetical protein